jgi:flagellar hook-associated protein 2
MGTTTSAIFNGNSRYSQDFQAVIDRTTAIASLPITQMQNQKKDLTDQTTALTGLGDKFSKLQSAIDGITQSLGGGSFQASVSDPSKLSVTLSDGAVEGNYSIEVLDAGSFATSMSTSSWVNAPGAPHPYKISIGGVQHSIFATDNSAGSVAAAINSQYGSQVHATVINVGSTDTPDYRISLQATALGDLKPDLLDGSTSLQTQKTTGVKAHYIVNGSGVDVYSFSQTVAITNGVAVHLKDKAPGSPVNITVTRSSSAVSDALQAFATAYNAAVDEVDKQHGQSSGALAGDSIVSQLSGVLGKIATYTDGSQTGSLAALGLDLDKTGHLTFNSFQFLAADLTGSSGITAFLGSTTQGFIKAVTDAVNGVEQAGTGLLSSAERSVQSESARLDGNIADQQAIVDRMKAQLQARMAASDALIASMEQQYNYLSGMFSAMQTAANQNK